MKKVNAKISYSVMVTCPYCEHKYDLSEQDEENQDKLFDYIFGDDSEPGSWMNIGLKYFCPKCVKQFELQSIGR